MNVDEALTASISIAFLNQYCEWKNNKLKVEVWEEALFTAYVNILNMNGTCDSTVVLALAHARYEQAQQQYKFEIERSWQDWYARGKSTHYTGHDHVSIALLKHYDICKGAFGDRPRVLELIRTAINLAIDNTIIPESVQDDEAMLSKLPSTLALCRNDKTKKWEIYNIVGQYCLPGSESDSAKACVEWWFNR